MTVDPVAVDHRPRRLRRIATGLAVGVVVVFGVLALLLPAGEGELYGPVDQVAFFLIGVVISGCVLVFTRFRVRADARGVWARNALGERFFPWELVVSVDLPSGATWAQLELHDDETVPLLAVQTSDPDAVDVVLALRRLLTSARGG
jgi:hypothetical protein